MKSSEQYALLRSLGVGADEARLQAFLNSCRDDEARQIEAGLDYTEIQARVASVHTRQDIQLACYQLGRIQRDLSSIRSWVRAAVLILGAIALRFLLF